MPLPRDGSRGREILPAPPTDRSRPEPVTPIPTDGSAWLMPPTPVPTDGNRRLEPFTPLPTPPPGGRRIGEVETTRLMLAAVKLLVAKTSSIVLKSAMVKLPEMLKFRTVTLSLP